MTEATMVLGQNHYPMWHSGRCLKLLQHLIKTTTKYKMVEDVWDCYDTWLEPVSCIGWWWEIKTVMTLDLEVLWGCDESTTNPPSCGLGID